MVAAPATAGQVRTLAANPAVRSIWLNDRLHYLNDRTRVLTGADRMRDDPGFAQLRTASRSPAREFALLINDSGIDAHPSRPPLPGAPRPERAVASTDTGTLTGFTPLARDRERA